MQANEIRDLLIQKKAQYEMNKEAALRAIEQAEEIRSSFQLEQLTEWSELVETDLKQLLTIDFDKMTRNTEYSEQSLDYLQSIIKSLGNYLEEQLSDV